jgi:hypothetical protein
MLLKATGIVMMLDGVLSAMSTLPKLDTFFYRNWRDQSLVVAHLLIGALLLLSGRLLLKRDRDSFSENKTGTLFQSATLVAALVLSGLEVTRFDWPALVIRAGYTAVVLLILVLSRK